MSEEPDKEAFMEEISRVLSRKRRTVNYPIMKCFNYDHLPDHLKDISKPFYELAVQMAKVESNAETEAGLRKLLEAKDCAVRAHIFSE